MRLTSNPSGRASRAEVYVRTIVSRSADGEELKYLPTLSAPMDIATSGILSTIRIGDIPPPGASFATRIPGTVDNYRLSGIVQIGRTRSRIRTACVQRTSSGSPNSSVAYH